MAEFASPSSQPVFGLFALGPPGAGKTTFCRALAQLLVAGGRPCAVVNLDPAAELDFDDEHDGDGDGGAAPDGDGEDGGARGAYAGRLRVDVRELVDVERVMAAEGLGPNGALVYALEYLLANFDWLEERLAAAIAEEAAGGVPPYLIFDLPGQVELWTHGDGVARVVERLTAAAAGGGLGLRLAAVHLIDAHQ